jgi:hypothetical protein
MNADKTVDVTMPEEHSSHIYTRLKQIVLLEPKDKPTSKLMKYVIWF